MFQFVAQEDFRWTDKNQNCLPSASSKAPVPARVGRPSLWRTESCGNGSDLIGASLLVYCAAVGPDLVTDWSLHGVWQRPDRKKGIMTLVCVRLENSFNVSRITALADTRASIRRPEDGSFKTLSDTTQKLFAIPVRCYAADSLAPVVGAWVDPYFETTIGLGFSGSCFEALTIVAHVSQSLSSLVAPNGDTPEPTGEGLVNLLAKLCESYFSNHSGDGSPLVLFLCFGFDDSKPWVGRVTWDKASGIKSSFAWATDETLETIGQDSLFEQRATDWRERIQKHRRKVSGKPAPATADGISERELEVAHHDVAERKATEEEMLSQIDSDFATSIGGVLQRLELAVRGGRVVAGFTRDDRPYFDGASYSVALGTLLGPIPIVEKMGRQIRKPKP